MSIPLGTSRPAPAVTATAPARAPCTCTALVQPCPACVAWTRRQTTLGQPQGQPVLTPAQVYRRLQATERKLALALRHGASAGHVKHLQELCWQYCRRLTAL